SSVGHMGFVLLGVATAAAGSEIGLQAALLGNIAHGVITSLLFFVVGGLKDRWGSVDLARLAGAALRAPQLCALLCFGAVASFGLPGLAGFWGEAFGILAAWRQGEAWWRTYAVIAAVAAAGVVSYFLRALYRLMVPTPEAGSTVSSAPAPSGETRFSLRTGELLAVAPLVLATLVLGVWPGGVLALAADAVAAIAGGVN
ncbi:MAG: proton-conducting transporter membrane subunit, partial [Pseudonocardiaceae bacterium]